MAEHTPGPWIYRTERDDIRAANGTLIVDLVHQTDADARLIAAAPDLLAACEAAYAKFTVEDADDWAVYQELDAAIAKARGASRGAAAFCYTAAMPTGAERRHTGNRSDKCDTTL